MIQVLKNAGLALFCATALIVVGICLLIVLSIPGQRRKDREYEKKLAPSIAFVESFQRKKQRLPSNTEFDQRPSAQSDWMIDLLTVDSMDSSFESHGGKTNSDFAVRVWRGERWTYYFSWSKEFDIVEP